MLVNEVDKQRRTRAHGILTGWINWLNHWSAHYEWAVGDTRWAVWVAGGVASFAVIQSLGMSAYPDDFRNTLSATTQRWLGVYPPRPRRIAMSIGLLSSMGMFAAHVLTNPPPHRAYPDPDPRFVGYRPWDMGALPAPSLDGVGRPPAAATA